MKKADLVNEVAKIISTKKEAAMAIEVVLGTIKRALKKREDIFLSGFGTFTIAKRKARKGRNPKTGATIKIAAKVIPRFKPAKAFKDSLK